MFLWIALALLFVIVLWYTWYSSESFKSKREKAEAISSWLKSDASPSYVEYSEKFPTSDIIDYNLVRKSGASDPGALEKLVS